MHSMQRGEIQHSVNNKLHCMWRRVGNRQTQGYGRKLMHSMQRWEIQHGIDNKLYRM